MEKPAKYSLRTAMKIILKMIITEISHFPLVFQHYQLFYKISEFLQKRYLCRKIS